MKYRVDVAGRTFEIEIDHDRLAWVDGKPIYLDLEQVGGLPVYSLTLDDTGYMLFVEEGQGKYRVEVRGRVYPVEVGPVHPQLASSPHAPAAADAGPLVVHAPLAGRLLSLPVKPGQRVEPGQVMAVVESMKMQMELKAPCAGTILQVHGPPCRDVSQGEPLVTLAAHERAPSKRSPGAEHS